MRQKTRIPEQKIKSINLYQMLNGKRLLRDTDTTSVTTSSITSTHIFKQ